jgi:hypothetical protein
MGFSDNRVKNRFNGQFHEEHEWFWCVLIQTMMICDDMWWYVMINPLNWSQNFPSPSAWGHGCCYGTGQRGAALVTPLAIGGIRHYKTYKNMIEMLYRGDTTYINIHERWSNLTIWFTILSVKKWRVCPQNSLFFTAFELGQDLC